MSNPLDRRNFKVRSGQKFTVDGNTFEVGARIGDGVIGIVRKAREVSSGRIRAVKFLAPEPKYIQQPSFADIAARFRREGVRGSKLRHENLLTVFAYVQNEKGSNFIGSGPVNPFILMEYVGNRTVDDYIRRIQSRRTPSSLFTRPALEIAISVSEALSYLHKRGIVHRDVKPANIFISREGGVQDVKLGDFGVVMWGNFLDSIMSGTLTTSHHHTLGTMKYMSPEQAIDPQIVDVRSDIYSLGITLWELFAGMVLPSVHHVQRIQQVRAQHISLQGKLVQLDVPAMALTHSDTLFELLLETFHLRPQSRPAASEICGRLRWLLEQLEES